MLDKEDTKPIKENVRVFQWGLYGPTGVLVAAFRCFADAEMFHKEGLSICKIEMEPVMSINIEKKSYPADCYITLLAIPVKETTDGR